MQLEISRKTCDDLDNSNQALKAVNKNLRDQAKQAQARAFNAFKPQFWKTVKS